MNVTIYSAESASVDGTPISVAAGQNVYRSIIDSARAQAAETGQLVEIVADDLTRGSVETLRVDPQGNVQVVPSRPATAGEAGRAAAASPTAVGQPSVMPPVPQLPATAQPVIGLETFVRQQKPVAARGWRKAVRSLSGGLIKPGLSSDERHERALVELVRSRATRPATVVVMCLKGGIGKTSTAAGVGLTLARYRGDRVIALDANPDAGDLYERTVGAGAVATLTDLADHVGAIHGTTDLARYVGIADRLAVIAGNQEPTISESLSAADFVAALDVVQRYYNITLVDCGTGVTHPSMVGILGRADAVIIAGGYAVSGARRAQNTLRWLSANGYAPLARNAVVVLTQTTAVSSVVDRTAIEATLAELSAAVIRVPHDQAVADGAAIHLDDLHETTRRAYLEIAAAVAQRFA